MNFFRQRRAPIAWGLYLSFLFSVLVCGLHHGQKAAWQLQGLSGAFCSTLGADKAASPSTFEEAGSQQSSLSDCPVCGSGALLLALALFGLLGYLALLRVRVRQPREFPAPRDAWPPANPRAP